MTDFGQGVHLDRFPEMHIQILQDLVDSLPEMFILFAVDNENINLAQTLYC